MVVYTLHRGVLCDRGPIVNAGRAKTCGPVASTLLESDDDVKQDMNCIVQAVLRKDGDNLNSAENYTSRLAFCFFEVLRLREKLKRVSTVLWYREYPSHVVHRV